MDVLNAIILGLLQGATEFLPVSSSAHLVIGQHLLGIDSPGVLLEIMLHLGTLLSVVVYFRRDIVALLAGALDRSADGAPARREIGFLALATLPAVLVALILPEAVDAAFESVAFVGWMLLVTSLVLVSSRWTGGEAGLLTVRIALLIGLAQAFAILPGISRSGATIVAGLWLGLAGTTAARFSFLMAIPAILGAALFKLAGGVPAEALPSLAIGVAVAALTGYAIIAWLMRLIGQGRLYLFAGYTLLAGLVVIFTL